MAKPSSTNDPNASDNQLAMNNWQLTIKTVYVLALHYSFTRQHVNDIELVHSPWSTDHRQDYKPLSPDFAKASSGKA